MDAYQEALRSIAAVERHIGEVVDRFDALQGRLECIEEWKDVHINSENTLSRHGVARYRSLSDAIDIMARQIKKLEDSDFSQRTDINAQRDRLDAHAESFTRLDQLATTQQATIEDLQDRGRSFFRKIAELEKSRVADARMISISMEKITELKRYHPLPLDPNAEEINGQGVHVGDGFEQLTDHSIARLLDLYNELARRVTVLDNPSSPVVVGVEEPVECPGSKDGLHKWELVLQGRGGSEEVVGRRCRMCPEVQVGTVTWEPEKV